jgi:AcrR family transcriptional regulator
MAPDPDLRTRNLAHNRAQAARIALELFEQHGYDAVGIDDIAAAAGISRRTFFRYFESKEGVVLPFEGERLDVLRQTLAARADHEPPLTAVRRAVQTIAAGADDAERTAALARMRIVESNPSVHARSLELLSQWETAVREVIAEAEGEDPETSMSARVTAAAAIAAFRAAAEVWLANGGAGDLTALLDEAFDVLAAGLAFSVG